MRFVEARPAAIDLQQRRGGPASPGDRWMGAAYGVVIAALASYWVSVAVRHGQYSTPLDGWLVDGIELAAGALCLTWAVRSRQVRPLGLFLGLGILCWALGDCALTVESLGGATPSVPSVADGFYLCFYPLTYAAAIVLMRSHWRRLPGPVWLDGLVAGLGSAAVCAAFFFHRIVQSSGQGKAGTVTHLAYPIGDLVLMGIAVGGMAVVPKHGKTAWGVLAVGMSIVAVGDFVNLFSSLGSTSPGNFINSVAWPTAVILMSTTPRWLQPRPVSDALVRPSGFFLPAAAAACALGIVLASSFHPIDRAAIGLSAATLVVAGTRGFMSMRALRAIGHERHQHAVTDELTGLRNRRYLSGALEDYFATRKQTGGAGPDLAFVFVDLVHFKEVNDSFGHPAGDEVLRQLGARLRGILRAGDVAVRLGGDEFALLLPDVGPDGALEVARWVTAALEEPFALRSVQAVVGASIGIAMASGAAGPAELMWQADVAMYRAKQSGSNYAFHGDGHVGADRMQLVEHLRAAIDQRQLLLHYQPLLHTGTGRISGAEALLRWVHPELGMVPPLEFLPLAEEAGFMKAITEFVLDEALAQVAEWRSSGHNLAVSVNIAPGSLVEEGFAQFVEGMLGHHGLSSEALVLEVTETAVIGDSARCKDAIASFDRMGIVVSIDDFGSGATSLAYLSQLRGIRELKLDRVFITNISTKDRELELVRATIELGHAMGLRVVAEGIEDGTTLGLLVDMGCDIAQGFYIGRPKPAADFAFGLPALALEPAAAPIRA